MEKRSKFHKSSLYCPDDKDLYDFLKATGASLEKMGTFLRRRGVYLSKSASADEARKVIAASVLAWTDISSLIDFVDLRESSKRLIPKRLNLEVDRDILIQAFRDVESHRQKRYIEHYKISPLQDGDLTVDVDYLAVRNERNRMTQKENDTLSFIFKKTSTGFSVMHTNCETAVAIYETLRGTLAELTKSPNAPTPEIESVCISLKKILNTELRVKFFRTMSENIAGFEYGTMLDVKVCRLPKELRVKAESSPSDVPDESEGDIERIKRVIISGRDLHRTKQLSDYLAQGFFISGMSWQSHHLASDELIDFYAGFGNQQEAEEFDFCVYGKHVRVDGLFEEARENLPRPTANAYCALLQEAAFEAFNQIVIEAESENE